MVQLNKTQDGWKPLNDDWIPIYEAAEDVKQRCLIKDGSVFTDEKLWTKEACDELIKNVVEKPIKGNKPPFIDKLKIQLKDSSSTAQKLAAEIYWLMKLADSYVKSETKQKNIETIWGWSKDKLDLQHRCLKNKVLQGIGTVPHYGIWKNFNFAICWLETLKERDVSQRYSLLMEAPWQFAEELRQLAKKLKRKEIHNTIELATPLCIQHLLYPDYFENIFAKGGAEDVLKFFYFKGQPPKKIKEELEKISFVEKHKKLRALRENLQKEHPEKTINFYDGEDGFLQKQWDPKFLKQGKKKRTKKRDSETSSSYIRSSNLRLNQILYGPPGTGKTYHTIDKAMQILDPDFYEDYDRNKGKREDLKNRYDKLVKKGRIRFVTFHQSFSYEDFVEGLRAKLKGNAVDYSVEPGIFKQICDDCRRKDEPYVLIIDEINRGNISNIFGELITLIEDNKRAGEEEKIEIVLPYSKETFSVPNNLYIIGTMNTADRSLVYIDTALRRRFFFEEMMPNPDLLEDDEGKDIMVGDINIKKMVARMNERIELLYDREHTLGHSFFLPLKDDPSIKKLAEIFQAKILPLLEEYFYEDWGKISLVLGDNGKKDDREKFYTKKDKEKIKELLNNENASNSAYSRNKNALKKQDAYIGIYKRPLG